jgi:hypothetical protein
MAPAGQAGPGWWGGDGSNVLAMDMAYVCLLVMSGVRAHVVSVSIP